MRISRILVGGLVATASLGLFDHASAHTANVNPTCDGLGIQVFLYPAGVTTTVTIDGKTTVYTGGLNIYLPWDDTKSHTWSVSVDNPGTTDYDFDFGGIQEACVLPPTTQETVPPTTEETTTTSVESTTTTTVADTATTTVPPTTTVVDSTTTTTVPVPVPPVEEVAPPAPPVVDSPPAPPVEPSPPATRRQELPATGSAEAWLFAKLATIALVLGGGVLFLARRKA